MKGRFFLAFVLTALVGSALHFGYDLCPSPLVGLICPVSESVWEHLKLLYWPFLASGFLLNRKAQDAQAAWSGTLAALLALICSNIQRRIKSTEARLTTSINCPAKIR